MIRHSIIAVFGILCILTGSCEKRDYFVTFDEFLSNKDVVDILISNNRLWVLSSTRQDFISYRARIPDYQISLLYLENNEYLINDQIPTIKYIAFDNNYKVYLVTHRKILLLNDDLSYELYFQIQDTTSIKSIAFEQSNDLWIATNNTGLYYYNGSDAVVFNTSNSVLNSNNIISVLTDSESNVWVNTCNELFEIDENKTFRMDTDFSTINNSSCAFDLSVDKNNTFWVSKWDGNKHRIYKKEINSQWVEVESFETDNRPIKFIKPDSKGNIWIAYSLYPKDRLAYYDSGMWNEIQFSLDEINIRDVEIVGDEIFVGTTKGIYKTAFK